MDDQYDAAETERILTTIESVRRACRDRDGIDPLDEAAELALEHHGLSGATAVVDPDGTGFALVRDGDLLLAVAPEARGRGVATSLLERLAASAETPDRAWSHGDHPGAAALGVRHGWQRSRELWVMRRGLGPDAEPLPPLPEPPSGLRLRSFRDGSTADRDGVLAVNAAAFAHHPEQGALDAAGFAERTAEPWWDPAGLILATDTSNATGSDDRVRALHWTKRHSPTLGEVYVVGVAPDAQGGGLGRLVTLAGLHHLADGGSTEVLLYVEADNAAAVHVYSGLGFEHAAADTHVQYTRD